MAPNVLSITKKTSVLVFFVLILISLQSCKSPNASVHTPTASGTINEIQATDEALQDVTGSPFIPTSTGTPPSTVIPTPIPGTYILYARNSVEMPETISIRYISPETRDVGTLIEESPFSAFSSELSPDGRTIAFLDVDGSSLHIFDVLEGFEEEIHLPDRVIRFTWTPDGDRLIVETMDEIALFDPWSGEWSTVYSESIDTDFSCGSFKWSPDERWFAFICGRESSGPSDPRNGIYVMDASCLRENTNCNLVFDRQLPETAAYDWSPDGQTLALCALQDGKELELFIYSPDTDILATNRRCGSLEKIEWSPDGDQIAGSVVSYINLYDLSSGTLRSVLRDENMVRLLSWIQFPVEKEND